MEAYLAEQFNLVDVLVASVVSCVRAALRVLVGHAGSDSCHDLHRASWSGDIFKTRALNACCDTVVVRSHGGGRCHVSLQVCCWHQEQGHTAVEVKFSDAISSSPDTCTSKTIYRFG